MKQQKRYLSTDDAAYALGVTRPTVISYIKQNRIQAAQTGKAYKITPEALADFAGRQGMSENPLDILAKRNGNSKKTVPLEAADVKIRKLLHRDQSSPIRENSDALYFLSIQLHDARDELVYRVRESYLIIGRSHLATLSIQDPYVSNIHATLTYEKGFVRLKDESTNGTQVGDVRLKFGETRDLGDGDEFMVGNSLLKILSPHKN